MAKIEQLGASIILNCYNIALERVIAAVEEDFGTTKGLWIKFEDKTTEPFIPEEQISRVQREGELHVTNIPSPPAELMVA